MFPSLSHTDSLSAYMCARVCMRVRVCVPSGLDPIYTSHTHNMGYTTEKPLGPHGTAWHGTARHGTVRHGTARHGTARHGTADHGTADHGTAQQTTVLCDMPATLRSGAMLFYTHRKGGRYGWKPSSSSNLSIRAFSNSNFSIRAFRAYPLIEIRQRVPCRAIRGNNISVNSTLPPLNAVPLSGVCPDLLLLLLLLL